MEWLREKYSTDTTKIASLTFSTNPFTTSSISVGNVSLEKERSQVQNHVSLAHICSRSHTFSSMSDLSGVFSDTKLKVHVVIRQG